ncbi:MAG: hypothetical protein AAGJ74_14875 [Pseudomonadota bacterium]
MIRRIAWVFAASTNTLFAALTLGMAFPGAHRALAPEAFGLVEIAPRVWTDAPGQREAYLALVDEARARVAAFFDDRPPRPTLILCATRVCARRFGVGGNGLSMADSLVMVAPGGLTLGTLTHEMTHARLHSQMGLRNIWRQPFPTWFDEGLATHVADHPKWPEPVTAAARARVREVDRFWKLDDAFRDIGVGPTYRAAAAEVAAIEAEIGRDGLLTLIARADAGERFGDVLRDLRGPP